MWGHPGKKLLFMGQEFGQWREWAETRELDWWLLEFPRHQGVLGLVRELNRLHRAEAALHALDHAAQGFGWIDADDAQHSTFSWVRYGGVGTAPVAVLSNFTPVPREGRLIGLPAAGWWDEILNTDAPDWGGSGMGNPGGVQALPEPAYGFPASARVTLPPLATIYLKPRTGGAQNDAKG